MANATEAKFGDPVTRIAQTDCWTVLLRPKQPTFGSLVLVCREPVQAFSEVSARAFADLQGVIARIEAVLRGFVAYEKINYLMLMMVDPDVHFHVLPRYDGVREFAGKTHNDRFWPKPVDLTQPVEADAALTDAVRNALRAVWRKD